MQDKDTFTAEEFRQAAALEYATLSLGEVPQQFKLGWVTGIRYLADALGVDPTTLDLPAPVDLGSRADDPCGRRLAEQPAPGARAGPPAGAPARAPAGGRAGE